MRSVASSRVRSGSVPVSTNVWPASGPSPGGGPSSSKRRNGAQVVDQRRICSSSSWEWISSATIGPIPGVSAICSGVAASSASIVRNCCGEVAARDVADALDRRSRTARSRTAAAWRPRCCEQAVDADLRRSPRARAAARARAGRSRRRCAPARASGSVATCFSPSPSMSITCGEGGQQLPAALGAVAVGAAGEDALALIVGVSQNGQRSGGARRRRAVRALGGVRGGRDHLRDHVAGAQDDHVVAGRARPCARGPPRCAASPP